MRDFFLTMQREETEMLPLCIVPYRRFFRSIDSSLALLTTSKPSSATLHMDRASPLAPG
jgi:hypothetical protein